MRPPAAFAAAFAAASLLSAACGAAGAGRTRAPLPTQVTSTTAAVSTTAPAPPPTVAPTTVPAPPATLPPAPPTTTPLPPAVVSRTGVVLPVLARESGAYRVATPCGRTAVVERVTPVRSATVVLDAGHGGGEPGATSPGGLTEKVINLAVVNHAKAALERAGVTTVLTRTGDYRMTLDARAKVVLALKPRAFVSVHHNAEPDGPRPGPGAETYYQVASAESKRLAGLVYEEVVRALEAYKVAWVADTDAGAKYRTNDAGEDYYGILRRTKGVPAVLAELGFVSNPPEAELYGRPDVQAVEGAAVARGILRFLNTRDPGSGFTVPYPRRSPAGSGGGAAGCVDPPL